MSPVISSHAHTPRSAHGLVQIQVHLTQNPRVQTPHPTVRWCLCCLYSSTQSRLTRHLNLLPARTPHFLFFFLQSLPHVPGPKYWEKWLTKCRGKWMKKFLFKQGSFWERILHIWTNAKTQLAEKMRPNVCLVSWRRNFALWVSISPSFHAFSFPL